MTTKKVKELETKIAALVPFIQSWQQNILKGARCAEVMEKSAKSLADCRDSKPGTAMR